MKNLLLSLTVSALAGAFTLSRPADWPPRLRRLYVLAPGVLTGAGLAAVLHSGPRPSLPASGSGGSPSAEEGAATPADWSPLRARPAVLRGGVAVVAGTAVSGLHALSLHLDAETENWLARRGVAAPRVWMAAAVSLASLGMDFVRDRDGGSAGRQQA